MSRSVALILDHNNPTRAELIAFLHTWKWPVLATTNPTLTAIYLNDRRVTLCIANTALLSVSRDDLTTICTTLLPHQILILAGHSPTPSIPAHEPSQIIHCSYPVPTEQLQPIISSMHPDRHPNAQPHEAPNQPVNAPLDDFAIDVTMRRLRLRDREVRLSKDELKLIQYLYRANGRICRYEDLAKLLYPQHYDEAEARHLLRGRMYYLQTKIERDPKNPEYLVCERGLGYQLRLPGVLKFYGTQQRPPNG